MKTGHVEAAGLAWVQRAGGGYSSVGGRFEIDKRGPDWRLIEARKKVRLFSTVRRAKAAAERAQAQPEAGETRAPMRG